MSKSKHPHSKRTPKPGPLNDVVAGILAEAVGRPQPRKSLLQELPNIGPYRITSAFVGDGVYATATGLMIEVRPAHPAYQTACPYGWQWTILKLTDEQRRKFGMHPDSNKWIFRPITTPRADPDRGDPKSEPPPKLTYERLHMTTRVPDLSNTPCTVSVVEAKSVIEETAAVASAILNARGGRRGVPQISNVLDFVTPAIREAALEEAKAAIEAIDALRKG